MGQPVAVIALPSSKPGILRFETNRVLTGTGHESYMEGKPIYGQRPADVLARRIFELHAGVQRVHINSSIVTIEAGAGTDVAGIEHTIADLYTYYLPGVEPPVIDTGEA